MIIIGYINGVIQLFELEMKEEGIEVSSLKMVYQENSENGTSVVNIKVSSDERLIAVSYIQTLKTIKVCNGYICLYQFNQENKQLKKINDKIQVKLEYSIENKNIKKGFYFFEISECNRQLIAFNQLLDVNNIRLNNDTQGKVYTYQLDSEDIELINTFAKIQNTQWDTLNFPNEMIG